MANANEDYGRHNESRSFTTENRFLLVALPLHAVIPIYPMERRDRDISQGRQAATDIDKLASAEHVLGFERQKVSVR